MGVAIGDIIAPYTRKHNLDFFRFKTLVVDGQNIIYQFLSSIRQRDGTPLMDSKGRTTSHLSGILYRNSNIVENDTKLIYVFDGKPIELKHRTLDERSTRKRKAEIEWARAIREGDLAKAKSKASQTSRVTREMIEDSKQLLDALGIPVVQAPREGEAQASYMVQKGVGFACASQDYDSLLFGAPNLARNIAITGRRKLPYRNEYVEISPETIELNEVLEGLGITREELVDIGILIGTDFNEGVSGYGPKKALTAIKEKKIDLKTETEIENCEELRNIFLNPEVTDDFEIEWKEPNTQKVFKILCDEHDFSEERVKKALEKFKPKKQTRLDLF
jgi:flap endonuclease-1